jgi:3-keto-5-aminohexanoate cleavage enzyme
MTQKVIISAALSGAITTRQQCPAIPYTPQELAAEAKLAYDAGATIVHIHARTDEGLPDWSVETFRSIKDEIKKICPEVLINFSTGGVGIPREERVAHIKEVKPDIAALNMGSMNYAIYSYKKKKFYHDHIFANPFTDIIFFLETMNEAGVRPEMECFDTGHIGNTRPLIDMGILKPPYEFSFVMGVLGGIPATAENIANQKRNLPDGALWQVIGIQRQQWQMVAAALTLGGNIRVGLEDNFYLPNGDMARSNGELVESAVRMVRDLGKEPATVAETRNILKL